jgi:hypothetical protein
LLQQRDDSDRQAAEAEHRATRDRENAELRQKLSAMEKSLELEALARKVRVQTRSFLKKTFH